MECHCEAGKKPIDHEKTKPQTLTVVYLFLGFLHVMNFIVIGQYTINLSE